MRPEKAREERQAGSEQCPRGQDPAGRDSRYPAIALTSLARPAVPGVSTALPGLRPPPGRPLLGLLPGARGPAVRSSRRRALRPLWLCAPSLLCCPRLRGRAPSSAGGGERGSAAHSPPTGVSLPPNGAISGRWSAAEKRARERSCKLGRGTLEVLGGRTRERLSAQTLRSSSRIPCPRCLAPTPRHPNTKRFLRTAALRPIFGHGPL